MKIYVHKVRMNPIDGWGQSTGLKIVILGMYLTKEKSVDAKNKRDSDPQMLYCDVGSSWIDEETVQ